MRYYHQAGIVVDIKHTINPSPMNSLSSNTSIVPVSLSYSFHNFKRSLINDEPMFIGIREENIWIGKQHNECLSITQIRRFIKIDILPFFKFIFSFELFDEYEKKNDLSEQDFSNYLRTEFIEFVYEEAKFIFAKFRSFQTGNEDFYSNFISENESVLRKICLFIFKNSKFIGGGKLLVLEKDANAFLKEFTRSVLISVREKPLDITPRLVRIEINRIQTLILKNADYNFLSWYLNELKCLSSDLKFIWGPKSNYNLTCTSEQLKNLYAGLVKHEFIDIDVTSEIDFLKVFLEDWYSHNSICALNMDHPQTNHFLQLFNKSTGCKPNLTDIEKVKNIINNNGHIKSSALSAAASRNRYIGPKRDSDLIDAFSKVNR